MSSQIEQDNLNSASARALRASEIRYRRLFETARDGILILDAETQKITDVNPYMVELLGYPAAEFLGRELWEVGLLRDAEESRNAFREMNENGTLRYHRLPLNSAGEERAVEIVSNVYEEGDRRVVQCNIRDVTERFRAQEELNRVNAENERRVRTFESLLSATSDMTYSFDRDFRFRYANKPVLDLYGKTLAELIGKSFADLDYPEDLTAGILKNISQVFATGQPLSDETRFPDEQGNLGFYEYVFNPVFSDGVVEMVVGSARDITERKRAEQLMLESEEKYRNIVETTNEAIWLIDNNSRVTYSNQQGAEMLGYTVEELLGRSVFDFVFEADVEDVKTNITERLDGISRQDERRLRRKDGSEVITLYSASPTINQAGEITGLLTMNVDITKRKQAEELLRQAEANYRNLVESSPAIVYLVQPFAPYAPIYVSPNIVSFGYSLDEWFARPDMWVSIMHPEDRARVLRITEEAMNQDADTELEYRIFARDGQLHWVQDKGRFIKDEHGNKTGWQGLLLDITKTKQLEEQLRQSQKLESVGLLAGGIAHDFNNMLTAINGYSELTLRKLNPADPLRSNIEEIKKAGQRSSALTDQLLAFSRRQILRPVVINLNGTITDTMKLLRRLIGEDIQLAAVLDPQVGQVKVDPGQFSQIIMNLAVNARDAMPQGGKLTIETGNVSLDAASARRHFDFLPGDYILVAVSDTGTGMSDEIKAQIFEPFFTTKSVGQGTGLGLATVYGIVKQSGGNIEVESTEGSGTTFKIYLPRVADQAGIIEKPGATEEMPQGTATILLVEDEQLVRNLTRQILTECGYTVIEAENGVEALAVCDRQGYNFDLLMTDVVMPQMGGRELAEKLTAKLPNLRILYTSGYTDDAVVRHGVIGAHTNFIQKPFSPKALANKIKEILDK